MYRGKRVSVLVPAFLEEKHIATVLKGIPEYVDKIFVIDDASPDSTYQEALSAGDNRCEVIRHSHNLGVGGAIKTGHLRALEARMDYSVIMAGDDQMDPDELPKLLDKIIDGNFGFVKANRFYSRDSFKGMPRHRIFGNIVLTFLNKVSTGYWHIFDPQNGYTVTALETLKIMPFERISNRYDFENDWLNWMCIYDIPISDVPIPARYQDETSTIKLRSTVPRMLKTLWKGFWNRLLLKYILNSFSPVALMLISGLLISFPGTVGLIWLAILAIGPGEPSAATIFLFAIPFLVGTQLLIQALVLDIQASPGANR